ncbi:palmitoyltransferase Pfa3 [Schizosaccharomyces osmophilus]|uniref:Palmitoyltransferase n=1 Tax=Schizosaccharomyces osmophilus TaxID=2545709 RepID=A0AAE9WBW6_9SCHI|nr:palmitoyltransferase Pfa3 [Schizosaccharomyces osmophilus]WBW73063.1 palmitoyltransferase Pfa3 [Schizosaccharomyces osmophilus]
MGYIRGLINLSKRTLLKLFRNGLQIFALLLMTQAQWLNWVIYKLSPSRLGQVQLVLYVLMVFTYVYANITPPGTPVTALFEPKTSNQYMKRKDGMPRYCGKCMQYKADRTHHCSRCDSCVLRMDHHCLWFRNCIGFQNHKLFYLVCLYLTTYALTSVYSTFMAITKHFTAANGTISSVYLVFWGSLFAFAFGLSIVMVAFTVYHTFLLFQNITTLESMKSSWSKYAKSTQPFNVGLYNNWCQVMGSAPWFWFLPVKNSIGNGTVYPINQNALPYIPSSEEKLETSFEKTPAPIGYRETEWASDEEEFAMKSRRWNPHLGQFEWLDDLV